MLRSTHELENYGVRAIDTSDWWMGHQVLIAPRWIDAPSSGAEI